jgi:hypothetical protein
MGLFHTLGNTRGLVHIRVVHPGQAPICGLNHLR